MLAQILEAAMLVCFGLSWPLNAYKAYKAQTAAGTSWQFIALITLGYFAGIAAKMISGQVNWVLIVYLLNLVFLGANWWVYFRNVALDRSRVKEQEAVLEPEQPFSRVLVATDGSSASLRAAEFVCSSLSGRCGSVEVVSVQPDSSEAAQEQARSAASRTAEVFVSCGIQSKVEVCTGNPAVEIVRAAQLGKADMVVMGSRGLSGFESMLLGSVSREVADKVGCPVLVVK